MEIQPHNIAHLSPILGVLVVKDSSTPVRKKHSRRTRCAWINPPNGGRALLEMHDVVVETHDCGRVMVYGKQRTEVGSRSKVTGQIWWCEAEDIRDAMEFPGMP